MAVANITPLVLTTPSGTRQNLTDEWTLEQLEHREYLNEVSLKLPDPPITRETASYAWVAWLDVRKATGFSLPVPAACTGPDGKLLYTWDRGRHHLELEIIPGQAAEFFYRDRETGELWGEDYTIGGPVPAGAVQRLHLFV